MTDRASAAVTAAFTDGELARDPGRLPDPVAHRARRQAAGLPRLRRHLAASRCRCSTPSAPSTSSTTPRSTAARTSSPRRPPTRFEAARATVAAVHRGAPHDEVVFTKNATEALNLVAYAFSNAARRRDGRRRADSRRFALGPGDEILVTEMEHHANLVPWQELARRTGATLRWIAGDRRGPARPRPTLDALRHRAHQGLRVHPRVQRARHGQPGRDAGRPRARAVGALTVLDACQSVPHLARRRGRRSASTSLAFSGHKMFGPTGVGVLWGRYELLAAMPPFLTGGSMIEPVRMEGSTYAAPPQRFEAGVPMAAQAVGAGRRRRLPRAPSAWTAVTAHEHALTAGAARRPGAAPVGPGRRPGRRRRPWSAPSRSSSRASTPTTSARSSTTQGIAVRVGHHCAWPLHRRIGVDGDDARQLRGIQHAGRGRRAARGARPGARGLRGGESDGPLPGDHPRALQAPPPRRAARAVRRAGAPRQPDLRRRGHPARPRRRRRRRRVDHRRVLRRPRAAPSPPRRPRCSTDEVIGHTVRRGAGVVRGDARDAAPARARTPATRTLIGDGVAFAGVSQLPSTRQVRSAGMDRPDRRARPGRRRHLCHSTLPAGDHLD